MPSARQVSVAMLLVGLSSCSENKPLDKTSADRLLAEADGQQLLFCRLDVVVLNDVVRWQSQASTARSSDCVGVLASRGVLTANCLADESARPCPGVRVELASSATRIVEGRLEVQCGTIETRARSLEAAGGVTWITTQTALDVEPGFGEQLEACRPVPGVLPETRTRVSRWRTSEWGLDRQ